MSAEALLSAALRGPSAPWPREADPNYQAALIASAREHGVAALVSTSSAIDAWPDQTQRDFHDACRDEAVIEAVRRRLLQQLFAGFRDGGIRCLVIKGAHLAYTHYPQPWLRPRADTDLLIKADHRNRADAILRALGYAPITQISGTMVAHQVQYQRCDRYGLTDTIDLHWKVTNPQLFADALTVDELMSSARAIPQLDGALGPSPVHALLLACVHRVAHHLNSDLLIWLYDIHLVLSAMDVEERDQFLELARRKRLRAICAAGLDGAQDRFGTSFPATWRQRFDVGIDDESEPSAVFLQPGVRRIDMLLWDLRTVGGFTRKIRLLRENLFPSADYIRERYGPGTPLLVAYFDRVVTGARKWFRPTS